MFFLDIPKIHEYFVLLHDRFANSKTIPGTHKHYDVIPTLRNRIHLSHKKSMKYSGHRKLLCELSKLSKLNADTKLTLMHLFLFTNSAQRELVSICTQSIRNCN